MTRYELVNLFYFGIYSPNEKFTAIVQRLDIFQKIRTDLIIHSEHLELYKKESKTIL